MAKVDSWATKQIKSLEKMKEVFNTYGWIQGDYGDEEMGFCLLGAAGYVNEVKGFGVDTGILSLSVKKKTNGKTDDISSFNDNIAKSKKDIFKLIDDAIKEVPRVEKLRKEKEEFCKKKHELEKKLEELTSISWDKYPDFDLNDC